MGIKRVLLGQFQKPTCLLGCSCANNNALIKKADAQSMKMDKLVNNRMILANNNNLQYDHVNRQYSDFSINTILSDNSDRSRDRSPVKLKSSENGVDLTRNDLNNTPSTPTLSAEPRPLNRVFESPWSSKNPVIFTPKLNPLNYDLNSTVITVQSTNYCFNYNSFNPLNQQNEVVPRNSKPPENNLGFYYFPPATVNNNSSKCPCKQCEIRNFNTIQANPTFLDNKEALLNGENFFENPLLNLKSRYECEECGKGFSQLRNYKYHLSIHKGTKEFAAHCPECGKMFNDKGYLSSHLKIHRNRKEYVCPHCPKSFNQRVAFNMHVRIHTGVKPHKCPECGKRFSRKMLLKQHLRTHSGEKPYKCNVCGKTFADRSNMTLHQRLHSGIKPFSCPICPKAFTKKHHLKTHLNYHTGYKPYKCPHKNCGQSFTQSSNMRTHSKKCQFRPLE